MLSGLNNTSNQFGFLTFVAIIDFKLVVFLVSEAILVEKNCKNTFGIMSNIIIMYF